MVRNTEYMHPRCSVERAALQNPHNLPVLRNPVREGPALAAVDFQKVVGEGDDGSVPANQVKLSAARASKQQHRETHRYLQNKSVLGPLPQCTA